MKDDYLWDKSGEPEAEVEHLERVLGRLRAKSGGHEELMPAFDKCVRKRPRNFPKVLLIAAACALAVLGLGAFAATLQQQSSQQASGNMVMVNQDLPGQEVLTPDAALPTKIVNEARQPENKSEAIETYIARPQRTTLESRRRSGKLREALINERERAEGLMAKEQLIKALQITSSKLNSVQKKVQGEEKQGPLS